MIRTRAFILSSIPVLLVAACVVTVEDGGKAPPDPTATAVATATATPTANPQPTGAGTIAPTSTASATPTTAPTTKMCTRMGCMSLLNVEVVGGDKLPKGKYVVNVEADGKKGKCTFTAPDFCNDKAPKCDGDVEIDIKRTGCQPTGAPQITALNIPSTPAAATITVTRDGKKVGEARLSPQYKEVRPNGPDCDPVCKSAAEKIEIK